jgi:hypothetical protein
MGEEHQPVEFEMQNITTNFEQQQSLLVATEQEEQIISR